AVDGRAEVDLPEHFARRDVEGAEVAHGVAAEEQIAARRDQRQHAGALLVLPPRLAGRGRDRFDRADVRLARGDLHDRRDLVQAFDRVVVVAGRDHHAGVVQRVVHRARARAVRAGLVVLPARGARADEPLLSRGREDLVRVHGGATRLDVDVRNDVLRDSLARPEELPGLAVERVDETRLAGNARDDLARLTFTYARIDPAHGVS